MVNARTTRRRELELPHAPALGWDLPEGHADDPPEAVGRAALVARYLAHALARDPATAGWMRRHRLTEHASQFSFWSPDARGERLAEAVSRIDPEPASALLQSLAAAQLAQARNQRANPVVTMFRAVETAAWGGSPEEALGDQETLANARGAELGNCLRRCLARARQIDPSTGTAPPAPAPDPGSWRGEMVLVDRPGEQCRVVLQFRLTEVIEDAASAAVLAQLLDGSDGLLYRRLRTEAGLVYGTVAVARDDGRPQTLTIGASLLRERLPATIDAIRRCVDEIDDGELPAEALGVAVGRVVDRVLTKLDEPFGALDDHRRRLNGQHSVAVVAEKASAAPDQLARVPRLSSRHRPAVAYIGPVDETVPELIGRMR
ncbi:insulinase family protein [Micromonospora orduensis]|uniref:Insulinase family protein n=1 Tax=Micromonospora orduensis TaxID=1420891 RepID=A0A5C4QX71_9ACTN|nr:insulinase family protein [Micromonospora orduensis]TNH30584.1 insulinase family protein [Micromonospora orduensis]